MIFFFSYNFTLFYLYFLKYLSTLNLLFIRLTYLKSKTLILHYNIIHFKLIIYMKNKILLIFLFTTFIMQSQNFSVEKDVKFDFIVQTCIIGLNFFYKIMKWPKTISFVLKAIIYNWSSHLKKLTFRINVHKIIIKFWSASKSNIIIWSCRILSMFINPFINDFLRTKYFKLFL